MKRARTAALLVLVALATGLPTCARAEEGGSGHYVPGAAASFIDALPGRPGLAVANYFTFYQGSASLSRELPFGGLLVSGPEATFYADTVAAVYETPLRLLGGNYAVAIAISYVWVEVKGTVTAGGASRTVRDTADGLGDLTFYPFMLGWTALGGDLKADVRFGIYAPTGDFREGRLANPGKNYWTFEPGGSISWLSSRIGLEVSAFTGFDINTKNDATDYQTGSQFHLDLTVAQHLPLWGGFIGAGANVFYYQQVTGDSGAGARLGDFQGRTVGIGPVVSYATKIRGADLVAEVKWLPELEVNKRLKGDYVWFKLAVLF